MKKIYSFALLLTLATSTLFNSCKKGDIEKKFDLNLTGIVLNSPAQPGSAPDTVFASQVITTGIEAKLNENGATLQNIKKIDLKSVSLTITTPSGQTFDGIEYLISYINAAGLGETKVAYKAPIPQTGLTTITQDSQFADLTEYIKQTEFNFILKGYSNTAVPAMTLTADISFSVTAMVSE